MTLATLVNDARMKKGFSEETLADLCHIGRMQMQRIESGRTTRPHLSHLGLLAKNLEIDGKLIREAAGYFPTYSAEDNTVAAVVERARLENFLSKTDLANLCDTEPQIIRNIENGKTKWPYLKIRESLSEVLNIDFSLVERNVSKNHPR